MDNNQSANRFCFIRMLSSSEIIMKQQRFEGILLRQAKDARIPLVTRHKTNIETYARSITYSHPHNVYTYNLTSFFVLALRRNAYTLFYSVGLFSPRRSCQMLFFLMSRISILLAPVTALFSLSSLTHAHHPHQRTYDLLLLLYLCIDIIVILIHTEFMHSPPFDALHLSSTSHSSLRRRTI